MTPTERKKKVEKLKELHEDYFQSIGDIESLYIPKMAYRPAGKDDLHISFFPSELKKEKDIYTEFIDIDYNSEDLKRTLYLLKYNPHWEKEYEINTSNSGFERHFIPVKELIIINDVISRNDKPKQLTLDDNFSEIKNPDNRSVIDVLIGIEKVLLSMNKKLNKLN